MHLLISEVMVVDAVLDRAITWVDIAHNAAAREPHDVAEEYGDCAPPNRLTRAWYDPRLSELRKVFAGC
jgi:hypothetical protein